MWVAGWTCTFVIAIAALSFVGMRYDFSYLEHNTLYRYQLAKIAATESVSTLFVGDSSLGNAIDAAAWTSLDGRPALSLALTGSYGYVASLNMLRRQLERSRPDLVVIMQTPVMMTKKQEYEGALVTDLHPSGFFEIPVTKLAAMLLNAEIPVSVAQRLLLGAPSTESLHRIDYIPQGPTLNAMARLAKAREKNYTPSSIRPGKSIYLRRISELCHREGLECVYAHGPWYELLCREGAAYLAAVNTTIREAGLAVVEGTPICARGEEIGDNVDHVRPYLRVEFTERYWRLIRAVVPIAADRTRPRS